MTYRETDIMHENGRYAVIRERGKYTVLKPHGACASETDSSYSPDADGLSIAIARCDYLARRAAGKVSPKATVDTISEQCENADMGGCEGQGWNCCDCGGDGSGIAFSKSTAYRHARDYRKRWPGSTARVVPIDC